MCRMGFVAFALEFGVRFSLKRACAHIQYDIYIQIITQSLNRVVVNETVIQKEIFYLYKLLRTWFLLRWRCSRHPAIERQIWAWNQQKMRSNCMRPRRAFLEWRRRSYRQLNETIEHIIIIFIILS